MIEIDRPAAPPHFLSESLGYSQRISYGKFENKGEERLRFQEDLPFEHRQIIASTFHGKCAFCESKVDLDSSGSIENFRPKSGTRTGEIFLKDHYWWLAYQWENLYLSCYVCSKHKRDLFPLEDEATRCAVNAPWPEVQQEKNLLLDPCHDDIEEHLQFTVDGTVTPLSGRGKITIELLGLNRIELVDKRKLACTDLRTFLEPLTDIGSEATTSQILSTFKELFEGNSTREFIAPLRVVFANWYLEAIDSLPDTSAKEDLMKSLLPNFQFDAILDLLKIAAKGILKNFGIDFDNTLRGFSIKEIEIVNFKSISKLKLSILPSNAIEGREAWLLLLGDNGIGKSSILQAIAIALCDKDKLEALQLDPLDILQNGKRKGHVKIFSYEQDQPIEVHFDRRGIYSELAIPPTFILAYGSTRLLPKGQLKARQNDGKVNIGNLFDYSLALSDVNEWLNSLNPELRDAKVFPALFDLLDLAEGNRIFLKKGKMVIFDGQDDNPIEQISDGFKSVIALACDIMKTLSSDVALYHAIQGVVLIDELGNHLHPRWRMKIASALRRAFPKLQFIVSTHEPLCLRGLSYGEVGVLVLDEKGDVHVLDKEILPDHNLLRVDQLLTSDLFGLINTLDENTEKKYEDYYKLLSIKKEDRTSAEQSKIQEYTKVLSEKEQIGNTPQLQAIYEFVNESFAKKLIREGFQTKQEIKDETVAELRNLVEEKKMNWL